MALIEIDGLPSYKMVDLSTAMLVITRCDPCESRAPAGCASEVLEALVSKKLSAVHPGDLH